MFILLGIVILIVVFGCIVYLFSSDSEDSKEDDIDKE